MPLLFPQLLASIGERSARELSTMPVDDAARRADSPSDDLASICYFNATGGTRTSPADLAGLRRAVVDRARASGYPGSPARDVHECDASIAMILRDRMKITAHEASSRGVWEYLSCCLMPDLIVWRFRRNGVTPDHRFLGGARNAFGRLWWRAFVLAGHLGPDEGMRMLSFLSEDDMVQTMERPKLYGYSRMMRLYYAEFRKAVEGNELQAPREGVNRDVHKRLLRMSAIRVPELLSDTVLSAELRALILLSARNLKADQAPTR